MCQREFLCLSLPDPDVDALRMQGTRELGADERRHVFDRAQAIHLIEQRDQHPFAVVRLPEKDSIEPLAKRAAEPERQHGGAHQREIGRVPEQRLADGQVLIRNDAVGEAQRRQQQDHGQRVARQQVLQPLADDDADVENPVFGDRVRQRQRSDHVAAGRDHPERTLAQDAGIGRDEGGLHDPVRDERNDGDDAAGEEPSEPAPILRITNVGELPDQEAENTRVDQQSAQNEGCPSEAEPCAPSDQNPRGDIDVTPPEDGVRNSKGRETRRSHCVQDDSKTWPYQAWRYRSGKADRTVKQDRVEDSIKRNSAPFTSRPALGS